ncbi:MAG: transposase domain-containing protein [Alphaproteobacteria bacterium]|nr:MAG: transposase domain-containing protein [Alphaproteobacteria bacterium]
MGARGRVPAAKAERPLVAKLNRRNPQLYLADVLARNRVRC